MLHEGFSPGSLCVGGVYVGVHGWVVVSMQMCGWMHMSVCACVGECGQAWVCVCAFGVLSSAREGASSSDTKKERGRKEGHTVTSVCGWTGVGGRGHVCVGMRALVGMGVGICACLLHRHCRVGGA